MLDHHPIALKNIAVIMNDSEYLNTSLHCIIRLLYKQRFLLRALTCLADCNSEICLAAIGELLGAATLPAIRATMPVAWKLAAKCLDTCERSNALIGALNAVRIVLEDKDQILIEQTDELIPRLLNLALDNSAWRVRADALRCVRLLANAPLVKTLPHKQKVIVALVYCIDDKKRLVRKEAVDARSCWFLIDAPM